MARDVEFISWHRVIDQRNLELARATAACVRINQDLLALARTNLERLIDRKVGGGLRNRYILRWRQIFDTADMDYILGQLTRDDETGAALRQADPFAGVFPAMDRDRIIEAYEGRRTAFDDHARRQSDGFGKLAVTRNPEPAGGPS